MEKISKEVMSFFEDQAMGYKDNKCYEEAVQLLKYAYFVAEYVDFPVVDKDRIFKKAKLCVELKHPTYARTFWPGKPHLWVDIRI